MTSNTALVAVTPGQRSRGLVRRTANGLARFLQWLRLVPRSVEPEVCLSKAMSGTGLRDLGGDEFRMGLEVLTRSLNEDAELSPIGRVLVREMLRKAFESRLRLVQLRKDHPELFERPMVPPLFVIGLPRSGTTHLHRLLCCDDGARPIHTWEVFKPIPGPGLDLRRLEGRLGTAILRVMAPELDAKHELRADAAEECFSLFNGTFVSVGWWVSTPVFSYFDWFLEQDLLPGYRYYRDILSYLQSRSPGQRLTLKSPAYTGQLRELLEVFPDAMVVQMYRDPLKVVPSTISLFESFHGLVTEKANRARLARALLGMLEDMKTRNLAALDELPPGRVLHLQFKDLVSNGVETVRRVYEHFGLPWRQTFEDRLRAYEVEHPKDRHGTHQYALEDYGITEEQVLDTFRDYIERFGVR